VLPLEGVAINFLSLFNVCANALGAPEIVSAKAKAKLKLALHTLNLNPKTSSPYTPL